MEWKWNEIETKWNRNETNRNETNRNEMKGEDRKGRGMETKWDEGKFKRKIETERKGKIKNEKKGKGQNIMEIIKKGSIVNALKRQTRKKKSKLK